MNRKQALAVIIAVIAAVIALKIPPYNDDGGLIGGTVYYPFSRPPANDPYISPNNWLLKVELAFIILSLITALFALRRRATRGQNIAMLIGVFLEAAILLCSLHTFNTILAPEFTFYLLNVVAVVLTLVVIMLGRGPKPNLNPDQNEYPV